MPTPLTAKLLSKICLDLDWTQSYLAKETGIVQSTIARHLSGDRDILADHFSSYVRAVPEIDKTSVVSAWLRDTLHPEDVPLVLNSQRNLKEEVSQWNPSLPPDQRANLDWLADRMLREPEYASIVGILARNAGFRAPKNPAANTAPDHDGNPTTGQFHTRLSPEEYRRSLPTGEPDAQQHLNEDTKP